MVVLIAALGLLLVALPALAAGLEFEVGFWNPEIKGTGTPAFWQIYREDYIYDQGYLESWETHVPSLSTSDVDLTDNLILNASLGLSDASRLSFSYWGAKASGSDGSLDEALDLEYLSEDGWTDIEIALPDAGDGTKYWNSYYDVDEKDVAAALASYRIEAKSYELTFDHRFVDTESAKVAVALGLRSLEFSDEAKSTLSLIDDVDTYGDDDEIYYMEEHLASREGKTDFSGFGPSLRLKTEVKLGDRLSVLGNLGYSTVCGESKATSTYRDDEIDTYYNDDGSVDETYVYNDDVTFESKVNAQIPVLEAELGVKYAFTDNVALALGYKASRWVGVPMAPGFDSYNWVPASAEKQDLGFAGATLGLQFTF